MMNSKPDISDGPHIVALTGATGYVGGRLAPRLLEAGYHVRCLVRSPDKLTARNWSRDRHIDILEADLTDLARLTEQLRGCDAAYYLVHSMHVVGERYADHDRQLAAVFAEAAERAGVRRIIYLGGLGEMGDDLSEHLSSRREVEQVLARRSVPVTVFRAAMIIGSGSASFEILRYLVERLPVMITPKWVSTESQPIAIRDVLHYLVKCLDAPETIGQTLDIGGPDIMSYRQIMEVMSQELGLRRRLILPVPVLTPRLSSGWIHLITPVGLSAGPPARGGAAQSDGLPRRSRPAAHAATIARSTRGHRRGARQHRHRAHRNHVDRRGRDARRSGLGRRRRVHR